ncbi:MAG: non-homologous end joining protein Ku [Bacteroidia bacterium]
MKAIWKGTLSFGLVSIPIKLFSAIESQSIGFKMICKKCKTPVHYKRFCEGCKEELSMADIVKGLEISKGEYIIFTQAELEKLKPEKSDRIEIQEFVDAGEIDPIYYNKVYFCAPQRSNERSYFLFKEVLTASEKIAIGKFVMREKEYVCAIRVFETGLLLTTLNYNYEIRDIKDIKELKQQPELSKAELNLAIQLVNQLYEEEFDMSEFRDTYSDQLKEMMKNRGTVEVKDEDRKVVKLEETPLLEQLKASFASKKASAKPEKPSKKPAKKSA